MNFNDLSGICKLLNVAPDRIVGYFHLAAQICTQYFIVQIHLV
jgi:hypothetical protein